jgi:hypothetical protein
VIKVAQGNKVDVVGMRLDDVVKIKGPKGSSSFNSEKVDGTVKLFLLLGILLRLKRLMLRQVL